MLVQQKQQIIDLFQTALTPLVAGTDLKPTVILERPRDPSHGDVACNLAMQIAKPLKKNPRELAQALVAAVMANPARENLVEAIEIAGPGFINLRLTAAAKQAVVKAVLQEADQYGQSKAGTGKKVLIE
ncbi:MAG: arginine--tRNA ligase, partial [Burkholderiaceae bacterium]